MVCGLVHGWEGCCVMMVGGDSNVVPGSDDIKGFQVLPYRWVVERTFGWFSHYRSLSKDYEGLMETSESMIYAAITYLMVKRLVRIKLSSI